MPSQKPRIRSGVERTILLIGCEGKETEPLYFNALQRLPNVRERFSLTAFPCGGGAPESVVERTLDEVKRHRDRGRPFDRAVCVLDVESKASGANLTKAQTLATKNKVELFFSNPCFEVWLLAHFLRTSRHFPDAKSLETMLTALHWRERFGRDYAKTDRGIAELAQTLASTATENAEYVLTSLNEGKPCPLCNSSTEVGRLVRLLLG